MTSKTLVDKILHRILNRLRNTSPTKNQDGEYFYMQFASSFYRIIWKIIVKVVEEAHNYFTKIATWILHFIFMGVFVEVRVRYTSSKIALFTALISN